MAWLAVCPRAVDTLAQNWRYTQNVDLAEVYADTDPVQTRPSGSSTCLSVVERDVALVPVTRRRRVQRLLTGYVKKSDQWYLNGRRSSAKACLLAP